MNAYLFLLRDQVFSTAISYRTHGSLLIVISILLYLLNGQWFNSLLAVFGAALLLAGLILSVVRFKEMFVE